MTDNTINDAVTMAGGGAVLGRIDQYELVRELGGGGFGTVYLAKDTVSGVEVAVKGLPPLVRNNREELENVRSNFALVLRLSHTNIAKALVLHPVKEVSYASEDVRQKLRVLAGDFLMVMEYAPGVTLSQWRRQFPENKVPLEQALDIVRQVASAIDYAHERRIVHRDIKPANVMMETTADGKTVARVLDFGLAAEIRSSMGRMSREIRDTSGTRPYMAPEQWLGGKQGSATDQYALAVLFHELITGEVPFSAVFDTGDPVVMMNVVGRERFTPPPELPKPIRLALSEALAKKPEERFASCGDFVAALSGRKAAGRNSPSKIEGVPVGWGSMIGKIAAGVVIAAALAGGGYFGWMEYDEGVKAREAEQARIAAEKAAERSRIKQEVYELEGKASQAREKNEKEEWHSWPHFGEKAKELEGAFRAGEAAFAKDDYEVARVMFLKVRDNWYWLCSNKVAYVEKMKEAEASPKQAASNVAPATNKTADTGQLVSAGPAAEKYPKDNGSALIQARKTDAVKSKGERQMPFEQLVEKMLALGVKGLRGIVTASNSYTGCVDKAGNTLMHIAAERCNFDVLQYLHSVGYSPLARNAKDGESPIFKACSNTNDQYAVANINWLVLNGADVNERNKAGESCCFYPIFKVTSAKVFDRMVECGADWRVRGRYGSTILHSAVASGNLAFAKRCIDLFGDVNVADEFGDMPIHTLSWHWRKGSTAIAKLLLDKGVDVNCRAKIGFHEGATPLHLAVSTVPSEEEEAVAADIIRFLLSSGADTEARGSGVLVQDCTPLHVAAWHCNAFGVEELLKGGANVRATVSGDGMMSGYTALHVLAKWCTSSSDIKRTVQILKENGLDVNSRVGEEKHSVLDVAVLSSMSGVGQIKVLAADASYETVGVALMKGCGAGALSGVDALLESNGYCARYTTDGVAPVPIVCRKLNSADKLRILESLLNHGAEADFVVDVKDGKDRKRFSALHLLANQEGSNVVSAIRLLVGKGARKDRESTGVTSGVPTPIGIAVEKGDWQVINTFVELGCNIRETTSGGETLLHRSAQKEKCSLELVKMFVDKGIDVDSRTVDGLTSLAVAAQYGRLEAVKALLKCGADVNAKDNREMTPVMLLAAQHSIDESHLDCLDVLMKNGADLRMRDGRGRTVFDIVEDAALRKRLEAYRNNQLELELKKAGVSGKSSDNVPSEAAENAVDAKARKESIELGKILNGVDVARIGRAMVLIKDGVDTKVVNSDGLPVFAAMGALPVVAYMLEHGADVNYKDGDGNTALARVIDAAREKKGVDEPMIDVLLSKGAHVNVHREDSFSLISTAMIYDQPNVARKLIRALLSNHEDVNRNQTPIDKKKPGAVSPPVYYAAVMLKDLELTQELVTAGANVNFKCSNGIYTPSFLQAVIYQFGNPGNGNLPIVKYLVSHGADINCRDANDSNLLAYAVQSGDMDIVRYCVEELHQDIHNITRYENRKDKRNELSIMHHAVSAWTNSFTLVKYLQSRGLDFGFRNEAGFDYVCYCADSRSDETPALMRYLVSQGEDVNAPNVYGCTPIMSVERLDTLKVMIELGANVNAQDKDGKTPLFHLAYHDGEFAKALISAGADVNKRDNDGQTPIFSVWREKSFAAELLAAGADINARDNAGKTALGRCFNDEMKAFLKSRGGVE